MLNHIFIQNVFIETPRLIIKTLEEADFPMISAQQKDPDFMRFFGGPRADQDIVVVNNFFMEHLRKHGFSQGLVFIKQTRECIGRSGLLYTPFNNQLVPEVAYFLLPKYWGKGFGTELGTALVRYAFDVLRSPSVYATIDPNNIASLKVAHKLGMLFVKDAVYERFGNVKIVKYYVKNNF